MRQQISFFLGISSIAIALSMAYGITTSQGWAQTTPTEDKALSESAYALPKGTLIPIMMQEEITTDGAAPGQSVSAIVTQDMFLENRKILSRQDRILGRITELDPPIKGRNAILKIEFDTLILENGEKVPIAAIPVLSKDNEHGWGGETTPGTKPEIVTYEVARTAGYNRVVFRGPRAMGKGYRLKAGTRFPIVLTEPLSIYGF